MKIDKLLAAKNSNPDLKKIHKYKERHRFFTAKFEIFPLDPIVRSSYIFDSFDNIFELNRPVGKGAFGTVKQGRMLKINKKVAIKIQNLTTQIQYHSRTLGDMEKARQYVLKQIETEDAVLTAYGTVYFLHGQNKSSKSRKTLYCHDLY